MSKKNVAHAKGYVSGIRESGWQCRDCGNFYDASVDRCPNRLLDEAVVAVAREQARHDAHKAGRTQRAGQPARFGYWAPERTDEGKVIVVGPYGTREEAEASAEGLPIVDLSMAAGLRDYVSEPEPRSHLADCPCEDGPCCPWMGDCTCQCMCDVIARVEDRIRAQYDPSESDADEGYRAGYSTAVADCMSNHDDGATYRLGYKKALLDVIEKARTEPATAFATVEELMSDLNEEAS